jgi:hypothetical protein
VTRIHGSVIAIITAFNTIDYYESVSAKMGAQQQQQCARRQQ